MRSWFPLIHFSWWLVGHAGLVAFSMKVFLLCFTLQRFWVWGLMSLPICLVCLLQTAALFSARSLYLSTASRLQFTENLLVGEVWQTQVLTWFPQSQIYLAEWKRRKGWFRPDWQRASKEDCPCSMHCWHFALGRFYYFLFKRIQEGCLWQLFLMCAVS